MHRLRERWAALLGGTLLLALSVSTVAGSDPSNPEEPRGQAVAAFVHSLVFGQDAGPDERIVDDEVTEGDEEPLEEEPLEEERDTHGACVSEVARDKDAVGGPNDNHGGAVSEAARETCREDSSDAEDTDTETPLEEERDTHGACVSEVARDKDAVGGPNDNHGGAVSEAARETCREDSSDAADTDTEGEGATDETEASVGARAEHGNSSFGRSGGNGNGRGNGHGAGGGGRP